MILFAMSLDLVLGYAGIVTLGHAAFFGVGGYAAGIYAVHVSGEPLSGLLVGGDRRRRGRPGIRRGDPAHQRTDLADVDTGGDVLVAEAANNAGFITGGNDGLQGVAIDPILGTFGFDMFGRTAYLYCLVVLFVAWLLRAPPGAFAVRPLAGGDSRERRAYARDRHTGAAPAADRLYDFRRARRHRRRAC